MTRARSSLYVAIFNFSVALFCLWGAFMVTYGWATVLQLFLVALNLTFAYANLARWQQLEDKSLFGIASAYVRARVDFKW